MDRKDKKLLKKLYFDPRYTTAFSSGIKLWKCAESWFKVNKATSV